MCIKTEAWVDSYTFLGTDKRFINPVLEPDKAEQYTCNRFDEIMKRAIEKGKLPTDNQNADDQELEDQSYLKDLKKKYRKNSKYFYQRLLKIESEYCKKHGIKFKVFKSLDRKQEKRDRCREVLKEVKVNGNYFKYANEKDKDWVYNQRTSKKDKNKKKKLGTLKNNEREWDDELDKIAEIEFGFIGFFDIDESYNDEKEIKKRNLSELDVILDRCDDRAFKIREEQPIHEDINIIKYRVIPKQLSEDEQERKDHTWINTRKYSKKCLEENIENRGGLWFEEYHYRATERGYPYLFENLKESALRKAREVFNRIKLRGMPKSNNIGQEKKDYTWISGMHQAKKGKGTMAWYSDVELIAKEEYDLNIF